MVRVNTTDPENGLDAMGSLCLRHSAVDIAAMDARLTRLARNSRSTGDHRSFDNLRANLVRDLLLGHIGTAGHDSGKRRGQHSDAVIRRSKPAERTHTTDGRSAHYASPRQHHRQSAQQHHPRPRHHRSRRGRARRDGPGGAGPVAESPGSLRKSSSPCRSRR